MVAFTEYEHLAPAGDRAGRGNRHDVGFGTGIAESQSLHGRNWNDLCVPVPRPQSAPLMDFDLIRAGEGLKNKFPRANLHVSKVTHPSRI